MQSSNLNSAKYAAGRSFLSAVEPKDATLVDTPGDRLILKEEENDNEVVY